MDIAKLVLPLSSQSDPCGEDMIFSPEFDAIQEARRFDDPSLAQGEWVTGIKEADWPAVVRIGESLLAERSKDLRIAAWLAEARCKQAGLGGLAEGYQLLGRLCETFWENLHPVPDDGDLEQRSGVFDWLANQTVRLVREIPLTHSAKGNFSLNDYEAARAAAKRLEQHPSDAEEILRATPLTMESFEAALKATPRAHFDALQRDAANLQARIAQLGAVLDRRMGELAPSFAAALDALDDVQRLLQRAGQPAGATVAAPVAAGQKSPATAGRPRTEMARIEPSLGNAMETTSGPIQSREQAIRQLHEVAIFFRRTEPHSPVAYLAEKAAKWSSMPLHEWLRAVVKDDGTLLRVEELLGVDPDRPE